MAVLTQAGICFRGARGEVSWRGRTIVDLAECARYLQGPVRDRLVDTDDLTELEAELQSLTATGMDSAILEEFLSTEWDGEPWQVGEALAECLLESEMGAQWPWNMQRDKRNPKASLPGADLVGLSEASGSTLLLFGEVKTSEDVLSPPNVMTGRSGMIHQLEQLATNSNLRSTLIKWLRLRCKEPKANAMFRKAFQAYLNSGGKAVILVGCLMRDTSPTERDLSVRAQGLASKVSAPMKAELIAWYVPHAIKTWSSIVQGA